MVQYAGMRQQQQSVNVLLQTERRDYMIDFSKYPIIKPSDQIITGIHIPEYQNTWVMTAETNNIEEKQGTWLDEIKYGTWNGQPILKRTADIHFLNGSHQLHTDIVYRNTLLPVKTEITDVKKSEQLMQVEYTENSFNGFKGFSVEDTDRKNRIRSSYSFQLDEPIYDWHLWGILVAGCPLQTGYQGRFLAHASTGYSYSPFIWVAFEVTDKVYINAGKWGQVESWLVDLYGEIPWKLWIAVEHKGPPVLQLRIETTPNMTSWWRCE